MKQILKKWWAKIIMHIILALVFTFVVVLLISWYLKTTTHHNQKVFTPTFKGLSIEQAQKLAEEKGFKIKIIDSVLEAPFAPGTVIDQTPPPNFKVKRGRTIFLTIKNKKQIMVKVPNLKELPLVQAKSKLQASGLRVGTLFYKPGYKNLVISQEYKGKYIAPGTEVPADSKIDLIVGRGESGENRTIVPDLTGFTLKNAAFAAAEKSLNIGTVHYDTEIKTLNDSLTAVVTKQVPKPNTEVSFGANIEIWLEKQKLNE